MGPNTPTQTVNPTNMSASQAAQGYSNTMGDVNTLQNNYQSNLANYQQNAENSVNMSGAAGQQQMDYNTFANMFANDPMGQQYISSNFNNAGSVGTPGGTAVNTPNSAPQLSSALQSIVGQAPTMQAPTVVSALPQLTSQNVGQGWQGFTNPVYADEAANTDLSNVSGVMNNIQNLINSNWSSIQSGTNLYGGKLQDQMTSLENLASMYMNLYNSKEAASSGGGSSAGAMEQQVAQAIDNDAKRGTTLQDLMTKYLGNAPGQADADTILQVYNKYNHYDSTTGKNVGYGAAKQSLSDLQSTYGVSSKAFTATAPKNPISLKTTTATTAGKTSTTGWSLKLADGSTKRVTVKQNPGVFGIGAGPVKPTEDAQQIISDAESAGITDSNTIIQALQNAGYDVQ